MASDFPNRATLLREHQKGTATEYLHGRVQSEWVRAAVYGANDGIVTTFAVVAGAAGAQLGVNVILILGIANMMADGLSMALGDYLGSYSELRFKLRQLALEKWEYQQIPDIERGEIEHSYRQRGYSADDAKTLVKILSKRPQHMVELGFTQEIGEMPEVDGKMIWQTGLVTFAAFVFAGSLPLLPYWLGSMAGSGIAPAWQFPVSVTSTAAALFVTGSVRTLITAGSWFKNGVQVLGIGSLAAAAAYGLGVLIERLVT
jgi:VIT1/CCC1 family predicted Fe2+/Mn2+ transporter